MSYLPLIIVAVLLVGALLATRRARSRSAAQEAQLRREITVGTQVMTTSGLYGTVVALNSDDTVILAVAPGVEVRWAFAALRDADSLPPRYRRSGGAEQPAPDPRGAATSPPSRADIRDDSGHSTG